MFGWILAVEQIPQDFSAWFKDVGGNPLLMLVIVNLIFFIAGMFIDSTTATLLLVPIVAPPVVAAGVDPIHLGIIVIFNLMIGTITPPFGLSLFLLSNMTGLRCLATGAGHGPVLPAAAADPAVAGRVPAAGTRDPGDAAVANRRRIQSSPNLSFVG